MTGGNGTSRPDDAGRTVEGMDHRAETRDFLTTRRARITPEQAGLPSYGTSRRVPGLRREEAAMLAGVSVDYYTRLERGNLGGVSDNVLEALARALQLDEAERAHLFDLVRATLTRTPRRRPTQERVRPGVQQILDSITAPAYVRNERLDILAANRLGEALYSPVFDLSSRPINSARFLFLSPKASEFFVDWDTIAHDGVAILRAAAGRDPYDKRLTDLIGELSTRSDEFRVRWAAHNVRFHRTGTKHIHHPVVGELDLSYETMELSADDGLSVAIFTAEPGSASQQALDLLGSWTATPSAAANANG